MSYKTILAVLRNEIDCNRVMDAALPLAAEHESHLVGVHAEPYPVDYAMPLGIPDTAYFEAARKEAQQRTEAVKKLFSDRSDAAGVSSEWRNIGIFDRNASVAALTSAFCADLVMVQQADPEAADSSEAGLETLLFDTGRPVLFVPYAAKPVDAVRNVLVAWNGRREAARAVFDALPLITRAKKTEIFLVDPEEYSGQDASMAGAEIAAALARHGANVTVETQRSGGVPVSAIIENRLSDTGADLLVMGAYSHMRLREILFGGVTKTLLESMPALTLMSR